MNFMRKAMALVCIIALVLFSSVPLSYARSVASDDEGTLGDDSWSIDSSGDIIPNTDSSLDIGASGSEVDNVYADSLWLGGVEITEASSFSTPMTDATGYVYPTDSGAVYRLYDAGYLSLGGGTAIDAYILFDGDTDDWYVGQYDTSNDLILGAGATVGTDARISIVDDLTLTAITIGDNADSEDKYIIFDGNATDQYLGYLDTYDMVCMGDGSTMDADMCFGIENASTPLLVLWNGIDGYSAIDLDYGSADITDHTFVSDGGTLIIDGTITLTNLDIISNATDDTIRVASEDADTILEVYTAFDTTGDATLKLSADLGDAAGEQWTITSTGATTDLVFGCDDTASGTPLTRFTISDAGVVTTMGTVNLEIEDSGTSTVTDVLNVQHFTTGTAAAGFGTGITFDSEDGSGNEGEFASIDLVQTTVTNNSEDSDLVFSVITAGTVAEVLRIVGASATDAGDSVTITANTTETDGITDILSLANVTGTATHNAGLGITWDFEDADSAEEQASLDVQLTTATNAAEDAAFIFSQQTAGAVAETFRLQGASSGTAGDYAQITVNTTETDAVLDALLLTVATGTATTGAGVGISYQPEDATGSEEKGSIDLALTDALRVDCDADFVFGQDSAGTITESLRLVAAQSETAANYLQYTGATSETNGIVDIAKFLLAADGTPTTNLGAGISIQIDDAGGVEEQASIDFQLTTATDAAEDCDIIISTNQDGGIGEVIKWDASASKIEISGDVALKASTKYKYRYIPLSAGVGTSPVVGGIGTPLTSVGLAGSPETGTAWGCVTMAEAADQLRFRFQLPETFVDAGNAADLELNFYMKEQDDSSDCSATVSIYEWGNTTAIFSGVIVVSDAAAAGWVDIMNYTTGIGDDSDIDADDILTIVISPSDDECDMDIYGCRVKYAVGLDATQ